MKNEKGITLIELLVSVVIVGLILVPLLTVMTGSFTRTVAQGKDTQLSYYGQEVMELIREQGYETSSSPTEYYCLRDVGCVASTSPSYNSGTTYDAKATILASTVSYSSIPFYEVDINVVSLRDPNDQHRLVTVVKDL